MTNKSDGSTAANILRAAIGHMDQRAATYDKPEGERSMGSTVLAFAAITGVLMTEEQGWLFMSLLKAVRSQQGAYRADSYEDGAAYFALAGEAAVRDRNGGWTPEAIKASALTAMPADFGQQHAIDTSSISGVGRNFEPASLIDDESPRMQAIGQNGNGGEHYDELRDFAEAAIENGGRPADAFGWIEWHGGKCPVSPGLIIDTKHRDGLIKSGSVCGVIGTRSSGGFWRHDGDSAEIIAYRLVKP